jgi:methionyl-tRNA formyltransferase
MHGRFSYAALHSYLAAGGQVRALVLPAVTQMGTPAWRAIQPPSPRRASLPMLSTTVEPSVLSLAAERAIPTYEIADARDPSVAGLLDTMRADVACVACWPWRIPGAVLARFPLGVLNVHPSLLPLHRGPAPLFWTLRHGDATAGVTVHLMDEALDTGPIALQREIALADGLTGSELEDRCATVGGGLLAEAVRGLSSGQFRPQPQTSGDGSYEPWPQPSDFVITPERSARWAFNFVRGAAYWGGPLVLDCEGARFTVREALGYDPEQRLDTPWERHGAEVRIRCTPGVLHISTVAP